MQADRVEEIWLEFADDLSGVASLSDLTEIRDKYLSRQRGVVTLAMRGLGSAPPGDRPALGQALNGLRKRVEEALADRKSDLAEATPTGKDDGLDPTLPEVPVEVGYIHPLRKMAREMEDICVGLGFEVIEGPEVESEYYNFEALNIPESHPARDSQDTFYLPGAMLLRTHTSPVQIRTMEQRRPPLRIAVPGRVFRRDSVDATHSPMFHQLEALVVDEGITFADLKGTLEVVLRALFLETTQIRLRPSYFPFVEPGAEVDISCPFCQGDGCRVCKRTGWIEVLGAGMVHPHLFEKVGYDPQRYTGFAWGMGIDRLAMLKYQIHDMRLLFENDLRFLEQF